MKNENFNSTIVATARLYSKVDETTGQLKVDKNGLQPIVLDILAGKSPDRNIIPGTNAQRAGIEVNTTYILQIQETEPNETYGRQFDYKVLGKISTMDMIKGSIQEAINNFGPKTIFKIEEIVAENTELSLPKIDKVALAAEI
jgi:hypothetical protein